MITNSNGTKRFEDNDIVETSVFNTVLNSFDKVAITAKEVAVNQSPKTIFSFTPNGLFNNNLMIGFYLRLSTAATISASLAYTDATGSQQFNILSDYYFASPDSYSFSPIMIAASSSPVSLIVNSSEIGSTVFVSSTVNYF